MSEGGSPTPKTEKLRVREVIIVEGKYDATALAGFVDGLILTTGGFSVFSDEEKKALIRRLGGERGLLILTDSDAAGFRIRRYVEQIAKGCVVKHAYIPAVPGKESRKATPGKEGILGVEGMSRRVLAEALAKAGAGVEAAAPPGETGEKADPVTHADLYEWGLSGGVGSAGKKRDFLQRAGLPPRLSKNAMCRVLNSLYTKQEVEAMLRAEEKPVLFWDFHGTLSLPDITWFDVCMEAAAEHAPEAGLTRQVLEKHLHATCLPWFTHPDGDTRDVAGSGPWWAHCGEEFIKMYQTCGLAKPQAEQATATLREKILQHHRYALWPDAAQTLQTLQNRGYRSYVLSNNYPELEQVLVGLGIRKYFEGVLVSGLVGYEKPRPEIFEQARKAAGCPAGGPAGVWMIGDNPADDIAGGKKAGFTTVAVHGAKAPEADHRVNELSEILALLP